MISSSRCLNVVVLLQRPEEFFALAHAVHATFQKDVIQLSVFDGTVYSTNHPHEISAALKNKSGAWVKTPRPGIVNDWQGACLPSRCYLPNIIAVWSPPFGL